MEPLLPTHRTGDTDEEEDDDPLCDDLAPPFDDATRSLQVSNGAMALTGTMLGGGLLSLPYAASKVGMTGAVVLVLFSGVINVFSYELIVASSRKSGSTNGKSFNTLASFHLGPVHGRRFASVCLVVLCFSASVGYLLLCGKLVAEAFQDKASVTSRRLGSLAGAVLVLPLSMLKSMHALRHANLFTVCSSALLMLAVVIKSAENGRAEGVNMGGPKSVSDVVSALPFFLLAFCAQFSVLPVAAEIAKPTRRRMNLVTRSAGLMGGLIYMTVACAGYYFTGASVCDSIFSNFDRRDLLCALGRVAVVLSLVLSYPMLIMPCRNTVFDLGGFDEHGREIMHIPATLFIVAASLLCAVLAPNIALVWALNGSTVTVWVSFTLPSVFYLRAFASPDDFGGGAHKRWAAWALLVFSIVASVWCTYEAVASSSSADACAAGDG